MTIFKEKLDEEYLTVAEAKELLSTIESERSADDRELRYELARAIEHVNRFAVLSPEEARELVDRLTELDTVDDEAAHKIADLLPRDRDELRAVFSKERYSVSGEELDAILDIVSEYR